MGGIVDHLHFAMQALQVDFVLNSLQLDIVLQLGTTRSSANAEKEIPISREETTTANTVINFTFLNMPRLLFILNILINNIFDSMALLHEN
jgi:hypothetical protein